MVLVICLFFAFVMWWVRRNTLNEAAELYARARGAESDRVKERLHAEAGAKYKEIKYHAEITSLSILTGVIVYLLNH